MLPPPTYSMNIPPEIILHIIQLSRDHRPTLNNLCLVSGCFLPDAQKLLYRKIEVKDWGVRRNDSWIVNVGKGALFFDTITRSRPGLAKHVRSVTFTLKSRQEKTFWSVVAHGFSLMKHLRALTFRGRAPAFDELASGPLQKMLFQHSSFQLHKIHWSESLHNKRAERTMIQTLSSQSQLRSLKYTFHRVSLPAAVCPRLDVFYGDCRSIGHVLPGHRVTKLAWIPVGVDNTEALVQLAQEISRLRVLSIDSSHIEPSLHLLAPHLASLEIFQLVNGGCEHELEWVCRLPSLRILVWTPRRWPPPEEQRNLVNQWFLRNRRLRFVYFRSMIPPLSGERCLRWERGAEPTRVEEEDYLARGGL